MLFPLLLLWLPLTKANSNASEYLEETAECVKNTSYLTSNHPTIRMGTKNFRELARTHDFFIDKSLLLKEIFKENSPYMHIFYLPPGFFKTTNLRMIQTFAEIELYPNSFRVARLSTWAYNFFVNGKIIGKNYTVVSHLNAPPLISHHMDLVDKHLVKYSVIYLDFNDVHTIQYSTTWNCIKDRIGREFLRYQFLPNRLYPHQAEHYMELVNYFNTTQWSTEPPKEYINLADTVTFLAESACKYFYFKPILCIDNYDALLEAFLFSRYTTPEESNKVLEFFNDFVDNVLGRDDLWTKIILTGSHSVHKTIMKELPGSKAIYNAFENDLSHFFGLTETEVRTISKHFSHPERRLDKILEYYKGYQMNQNRLVYNPWSVITCVSTGKLKEYWEEKRKHAMFMTNMWAVQDLREFWLDLLNDREISVYYRLEKFTEDDFRSLGKTLAIRNVIQFSPQHCLNLTSKEFNQVVLHFLDMGYLTCSNKSAHNLRVASLEVKKTLFEKMRQAYKGYLGINVDQIDVVAVSLHNYLFSRERDKLIDELTESFDKLFKETNQLFEGNSIGRQGQVVNSKGSRTLEYMGMQLRFRHGHKLDLNISNGFIVSKLGLFSIVVFNYDQSVPNADVLNQTVTDMHPWIEQDPEKLTSSITYLVIDVKNVTAIVEKRFGAEPPMDVTEPVSKEVTRMTTKKKQTSASKKLKTGSQSMPKSTRPFNKTGKETKKWTGSPNLTPYQPKSTLKLTSGKMGLSTNGTGFTNAINDTMGTTEPLTESSTTGISVSYSYQPKSTLELTSGGMGSSTNGTGFTNAINDTMGTTEPSTESSTTGLSVSYQPKSTLKLTSGGMGSSTNGTGFTYAINETIGTTELTEPATESSTTGINVSNAIDIKPNTTIHEEIPRVKRSTSSTLLTTEGTKSGSHSNSEITNPDTTPVSQKKSTEPTKFKSTHQASSINSTFKSKAPNSNIKVTTIPATNFKTTNTATVPSGNTNSASTSGNTVIQSSSTSTDSISKGSKMSRSASKGTKATKNWTRGTKFTKSDHKPITTTIIPGGSQMPAEAATAKSKSGTKLYSTTSTKTTPTKLPSYSTWEYVSWNRRPKPTYSTKSTTFMSRKKYLQLFFMVRDCDLRPDKKNPYFYQTIKTTKKMYYTDRK